MSETRILKVVLQITCQLLWLAGLVVGLSGMYLLLNFKHNGLFFCDMYIILPAVLAVVSAAFLLGSGGIGCCVTVRDSTCLQGVFAYLLVVAFCLEATTAALAYANIGKVHSELAPFQNIFENYSGGSQDPYSNAVDSLQEELQCCGIQNYTDWLTTPWFNHTGNLAVPQSCCNSTFPTCNGTLDQSDMLYPKGCQVKLEDAISFILCLIMYSAVAVVVLQIVGLVSVAQLMKRRPLQDYRILDTSAIR